MMTEYKPRTYGMMSDLDRAAHDIGALQRQLEEAHDTITRLNADDTRDRREWAALVQDRDEFREEYERVSLINARLMASNNARQKIISDLLTQRAEYRKILDKIESGTSASEVFDFGQHLVPADDLASLRDDISLLEQANESLQRHFDQVKKDRVSISKTNEDLKQKLRYTEASRNDHRNCVAALESEKDEQTRHAKAYYNDLIIAHKWGNELEARLDEAQRELDKANQKHGRYVALFDTAIAERDQARQARDINKSFRDEYSEAADLAHDELEHTKKALRIAEGDREFYMKRLAACYEKTGLPKGDSPKRAEASKYDGKRR